MELYVIGAGFSKAFNPLAPLMVGFLAKHASLLDQGVYKCVADFIKQCGFPGVDELNIETLLTLTTIPKPWLSESDSVQFALVNQRLRDLMEEVIEDSFPKATSEGRYRFQVEGDGLSNFAKYLLFKNDTHVITFNYDLLLENELEHGQRELLPPPPTHRFHIGLSYGFQGLGISGGAIKPLNYELVRQTDAIRVLKLHGSVNWRRRRYSSPFPNDLLIESCFEEQEPYSKHDFYFEQAPFIVPPVLDKATVLNQPVLNIIWGRAAELIREAKRIVFIGYSFPVADFYVEFMFRYYAENPEIVVVSSPNTSQTKQKPLKDRYRSIFGNVSFRFEGAAEYCNSLDTAQLGLEPGAKYLDAHQEGKTALVAEAAAGNTNRVLALLKAGADVDATTSKQGMTALGAAAAAGHTDAVVALLKAGADVDAQPKKGMTALEAATTACHTEIVELLKKAGAKE